MRKHKRVLPRINSAIQGKLEANMGRFISKRVLNGLEGELLGHLSSDAEQYGGKLWAELRGVK